MSGLAGGLWIEIHSFIASISSDSSGLAGGLWIEISDDVVSFPDVAVGPRRRPVD